MSEAPLKKNRVNWKKRSRQLFYTLLMVFIGMNIVAFFHSYKFTHFSTSNNLKSKDSRYLSVTDKVKTLFGGIDNPRPINKVFPTQKFQIITLKSNKNIECWSLNCENSKGTVVLFHGYTGSKSSLIDKSDEFIRIGYSTLLVDFMGSGGSEGNQTTLGFKESEEIKTCFDYLLKKGEKKIILFGTSMGAVAILKAINDYNLSPQAIIIECPFGSMRKTIKSRFIEFGIPSFPMCELLAFWGGVQNGFWAFSHVPIEYAKAVKCPTLLLYGQQDEKVSKTEIEDIYSNLSCKKRLKIYPLAGHENYLIKYKEIWVDDIKAFLFEIDN
jgi:uncharacterized protein